MEINPDYAERDVKEGELQRLDNGKWRTIGFYQSASAAKGVAVGKSTVESLWRYRSGGRVSYFRKGGEDAAIAQYKTMLKVAREMAETLIQKGFDIRAVSADHLANYVTGVPLRPAAERKNNGLPVTITKQ